MLLTPAATNALIRGDRLRTAFFSAGDNNPQFSFTLTPEQALVKPSRSLWVSRAFFAVGEQEFGFGGGSETPQNFVWPPAKPDASIRVVLTDDSSLTVVEERGYWGLFRMMQKAESQNTSSVRFRRTWTRKLGDGSGEVVVPCMLSFRASVHPFMPDILDYRCPSRLHQ